MKKKLLFVIPSLDAGGAEKSLVNLLNTLDSEQFSVDLFLFVKRGLFLKQVPEYVKIIPQSENLMTFQQSLGRSVISFLTQGRLRLAWSRLRLAQINRQSKNCNVAEQAAWPCLRHAIGRLPGSYDAAIGYLEKSSVYCVADLVDAGKKIGFIHSFYSKQGADHTIDLHYFEKLDAVMAVSPECQQDLISHFPTVKSKFTLLHNVISASAVRKLSEQSNKVLPPNSILSVGRLTEVKGFDMAIEAASILKESKIDFHWYIIGEGPERERLTRLIETNNLEDHVTLLGIKANPYPYIRAAKVFVQCSRYEGKSIAIDEAKILAKPIVLTNFTTAADQIIHNINGMIVDMTPQAIADGITNYLTDREFTAQIVANLQTQDFGTEQEIAKFYEILNA